MFSNISLLNATRTYTSERSEAPVLETLNIMFLLSFCFVLFNTYSKIFKCQNRQRLKLRKRALTFFFVFFFFKGRGFYLVELKACRFKSPKLGESPKSPSSAW